MGVLAWDTGELATVELDYDDVLLRATAIRVINGAPRAVIIDASRSDKSVSYSQEFPANDTTEILIPGASQNRLGVSIDERGRVDGIEWSMRWAES